MQFSIISGLIVAAACGGCVHEKVSPTLLQDWSPKLDQPIRQLREVLAATEQQQSMNYTSANLGLVLDAKLYILFYDYLDELDEGARARAIEEQHVWRVDRQRAFQEAYKEYEGGSFASYAGNTRFIEMTEARIEEIEKRLRQVESAGNAGASTLR